LLEIVTRLTEVRRRYVFDAGDGERYELVEERLNSVIADLQGWIKPGGTPVELSGLALRLSAVEEMMEAVGFPGHAHVIASVRETLVGLGEGSTREDDPPPARRFEPAPARGSVRSPADSALDEERRPFGAALRARSRLLLAVVAGLCAAGAAAILLPLREMGGDRSGQVELEIPATLENSRPVTSDDARPIDDTKPTGWSFEDAARHRAQLLKEVDSAEEALGGGDFDSALRHFAAAAAVDRHHREVISLAGRMIEALLQGAGEAFDNEQWDLADKRVADAGHLARGLYLETSAIEQTARRLAALTRFEDVQPDDQASILGAVGHAVRVTLTIGDPLYGRLGAFDGVELTLAIHSGIEGGGAEFEKAVAIGNVGEIRVYETESLAETVFER
jgi:hypothetical protein